MASDCQRQKKGAMSMWIDKKKKSLDKSTKNESNKRLVFDGDS